MKSNGRRFTGKLLVGALVVAVAASSAVPVGASQDVERPFRSSASGTISIEPFLDCDFSGFPDVVCDQVIETVFIATHLGKSTNTTTGLATLHVFQACTTPDGSTGVRYDVATSAVVVAANGDELYATTSVSGCGDGIGLTEPAGTYTITGGTGRFDGATGAGTVSASTIGELFSNSWTGTITY